MAKTKGQIELDKEKQDNFDKVLVRKSLKNNSKSFDGLVSFKPMRKKKIVKAN